MTEPTRPDLGTAIRARITEQTVERDQKRLTALRTPSPMTVRLDALVERMKSEPAWFGALPRLDQDKIRVYADWRAAGGNPDTKEAA